MKEIFNFNPGPSALPKPVLEQAQAELLDYRGTGISILETSHRSSTFSEILEGAKSNVRRLLELPENYQILFCPGGATQQFAMVPLNIAKSKGRGGYLISGSWSKKALAEAQKFGPACAVGRSEDKSFRSLPTIEDTLDSSLSYLHITSNNTIYGTQYPAMKVTDRDLLGSVPLISDSSSDLLHRPVNASEFALIYAGAQKNLGPAGVTLVIIRNDLLEQAPESPIATMLNYQTYSKNSSCYNTPPVYAIYLMSLVLEWIKSSGGLEEMERRNLKKAKLVYDVIDPSELYQGYVEPDSRSLMNVTFTLTDPELDTRFLEGAEAAGLVGLKGHRSIGGFRASLYNSVPEAAAQALADFMKNFERSI